MSESQLPWNIIIGFYGLGFHPECFKSMSYCKVLRAKINLITLGIKLSCGLF